MAKGMRVEAIEEATGREWSSWVEFLEGIGAAQMTHAEVARAVQKELGTGISNPGWWAQTVTVAFEQQTGRRVPGQRQDGTFQMSVSRSTSLGMQELMDAWVVFATNDGVVHDLAPGQSRLGGTERRIHWRSKAPDGSNIAITSEPKANGTAAIIAQQVGIPSEAENDKARARWADVLERFCATLDD